MSKDQNKTKVTRITASDSAKPAKKQTSKTTNASKAKKQPIKAAKAERSWGVLGSFGGYFKGAWKELRQVHWPTRSATWSLTSAVLIFAAFFIVFITLLDAGFKFMFEQILK